MKDPRAYNHGGKTLHVARTEQLNGEDRRQATVLFCGKATDRLTPLAVSGPPERLSGSGGGAQVLAHVIEREPLRTYVMGKEDGPNVASESRYGSVNPLISSWIGETRCFGRRIENQAKDGEMGLDEHRLRRISELVPEATRGVSVRSHLIILKKTPVEIQDMIVY